MLDFDLKNLEESTKEYTKAFRPCFRTDEYSQKYMKKFAKDRWQNVVDERGLELTDKDFNKYEKKFVKVFIDTMIKMIEEDRKKLKNTPKEDKKGKK